MKRLKIKDALLLIAVLLFSMLAFRGPEEEKIITIKFKQSEVAKLFEVLEFSKNAIQTSTAPAVQVGQAIGVINESQKLIAEQFKAQTDTTKKPIIKK